MVLNSLRFQDRLEWRQLKTVVNSIQQNCKQNRASFLVARCQQSWLEHQDEPDITDRNSKVCLFLRMWQLRKHSPPLLGGVSWYMPEVGMSRTLGNSSSRIQLSFPFWSWCDGVKWQSPGFKTVLWNGRFSRCHNAGPTVSLIEASGCCLGICITEVIHI